MNILYCGDENIIDGLLISITSLLKNNNDILNIYVLTINIKNEKYNITGISDAEIGFLDKKVKQKNIKNFVKKIDITEIFKDEIPEKNMSTRFTPCCMLRLYADKIEELPNKILYLDNDVIARQDISELYNQNIDNYEIAGVLDFYGKWFFKNNIFKFDYINSGVLLLNLEKIKQTKLFEKCRKKCREEQIFMPDQSSINKLATSKKILNRKFNEQRKLQNETVLQHFTISFRLLPWFHSLTVKPWQIDKVHTQLKIFEYDDIFNEYLTDIKNIKEYREVLL